MVGLDAVGRRVVKKVNGTVQRKWIYLNSLKPIAELDASNCVVSTFVYATHPYVPDYMVRSGVTYRILSDHLGSVRMVVNTTDGTIAQQMDYDEWGNVTQDTNPDFQPFGFAAGHYDPQTRLTRFGYRDYDAETGRWTAKDPILFGGGQANIYLYCHGDPVNWIDPFGLSADGFGYPAYWERYLQHVEAYSINVGPAAWALVGGLWPKSWAPATGGRPPLLGSGNPLTSVPRALGILGSGSTIVRAGAAGIGIATVGVGFYNIGVFVSGFVYAAFPGSNGLEPDGTGGLFAPSSGVNNNP
ncbi:MAG: RHS repeat-associated core domain-containing protein [Kiritimatiellae bacterium]|nr:RHS repeat-associated core domain-containing protein [Kiritimatiellia bacterium]